MDTLTHCVAGGLTPFLFSRAPKRAGIIIFGCLAGELPDIDTFFLRGTPEGLMSVHRGMTHALLWQPLLMLAFVIPCYLYFSCKTTQPPCTAAGLPADKGHGRWPAQPTLWLLCAISLTAQYIHLFLDAMTTFGTQLFLPFSAYRVALPCLFIIDLFLLVPLAVFFIWAIRATTGRQPFWSAGTRLLARVALVWLILYPLGNLAVHHGLLRHELSGLDSAEAGQPPRQVSLLTEPFSPFVWKKVVWYDDHCTMQTIAPLLWHPESSPIRLFARPQKELLQTFSQQVPLFAMYLDFAPAAVLVSVKNTGAASRDVMVYSFADVRYLVSPLSPAHFFGRSDTLFAFEIKVVNGRVAAYRYLDRLENKNTPWQSV